MATSLGLTQRLDYSCYLEVDAVGQVRPPDAEDVVAGERLGEIVIEVLRVQPGADEEIHVLETHRAGKQTVIQGLARNLNAVKQRWDDQQVGVLGVARHAEVKGGEQIVLGDLPRGHTVSGGVIGQVVKGGDGQREAEIVPVATFVVVG